LELWKTYNTFWCDHKPSISVYIREEEWDQVSNWVYDNFDIISGVSFFPYNGGMYEQAPYTPITEKLYHVVEKKLPKINWELLKKYEKSDIRDLFQNFACSGDKCEL